MGVTFPFREFRADPHTAFPDRTRSIVPLVLVKITVGEKSARFYALVDSGAEFCVFDRAVGDSLGLDVESGPVIETSGVAKRKQKNYCHRIELDVGGFIYRPTVLFAEEYNPPYPILGRIGFFDRFEKVIFDFRKMRVELVKESPRPQKRVKQ